MPYPMAFCSDGTKAAVGLSDGAVRLWDFSDGHKDLVFGQNISVFGAVVALTFTAQCKAVTAAYFDGYVRIWPVDSPTKFKESHLGTFGVMSPVFSPDGRSIAVTFGNDIINIFTLDEIKVLSEHPSPADRKGEPHVPYLTHEDWQKQLRDDMLLANQENKTPLTLKLKNAVRSITFSPDGSILMIGGDEDTVYLWSLDGRKEVSPFKGKRPALKATLSKDKRRIAISTGNGAHVFRTDRTDEPPIFLPGINRLPVIAFTPDGTRILTLDDDSVNIWRVEWSTLMKHLSQKVTTCLSRQQRAQFIRESWFVTIYNLYSSLYRLDKCSS
jgi:WD40 repeat protein